MKIFSTVKKLISQKCELLQNHSGLEINKDLSAFEKCVVRRGM